MTTLPRLLAAALLACAAALPAAAEEGDDVLNLYDEFVSSGAAASYCASPSNEVAIRFLSNFQWISTHAQRELGRRAPGWSGDQVAAELARRSKARKDEAHALVREQGCDATPVRHLVQRFIAQASWVREGA